MGSGADVAAFEEVYFFRQEISTVDKRWVFKTDR
jgi:hypothetical protein